MYNMNVIKNLQSRKKLKCKAAPDLKGLEIPGVNVQIFFFDSNKRRSMEKVIIFL